MDGEIGIKICGGGKVEEEVKRQVYKTNRVAGCLNYTIWKNKHSSADAKSRIYKRA
jgi:hypothetical protein